MESQPACLKNKKRTKAGVLVSEITLEDLQSAFHLPTERACVKLGVGLTILKRLCRKHGIARWPYRSLLKAGKAQRVANTPSAASSPLTFPGAPAPAPCPTPTRDGPEACLQPSISSSSTSQYGGNSEVSDLTRRRSISEQPQRPPLPASRSYAALAAALEAAHAAPAMPAVPAPAPAWAAIAPMQNSAAAAAAVQHPQAQLAKSSSQLGLLLSAIDACEGEVEPAAAPPPLSNSPLTPLDAAQPWAPFTPPAAAPAAAAAGSRGPGPQRHPFRHSARSAFRPVPSAAPDATAEPSGMGPAAAPGEAALEAKRAELQQRLAMLQEVAAQVRALAPSPPLPDAAAGLLRSLGAEGLEERKRLQLAEKLLMVRAALQARLARRRAALAAATGGRFSPLPAAGGSPLCSPAPGGFAALPGAYTLLEQYHL